jgi:hypothetical protein
VSPRADGDEKRRIDRERIAEKRAAMTEQQRRDARREHDKAYREKHREERREYDRQRLIRKALDRGGRS